MACGKRNLLRDILPLLPRTFIAITNRLLVAGALFFAIQPAKATLSEYRMSELINLYPVRDRPNDLVNLLKKSGIQKVLLQRSLPFAAICRFLERHAPLLLICPLTAFPSKSSRDAFNVPYGLKSQLATYDEERIHATSVIGQRHPSSRLTLLRRPAEPKKAI